MKKQKKLIILVLLILVLGVLAILTNYLENTRISDSDIIIGNFNYHILQHSSAEPIELIILSDQDIGDIPFAFNEQINSSNKLNQNRFRNIKANDQLMLTGYFDELELGLPVFEENTPKPPVKGYRKKTIQYFNAEDYKKIDFYKISLPPAELLKYLNGEIAEFRLQLDNPTNKRLGLYVSLGGYWGDNSFNTTVTLNGKEKKDVIIPFSADVNDALESFKLHITSYPPESKPDLKRLKFPVISVNDYRISIHSNLNEGDTALAEDYGINAVALLESALNDSNQRNKNIILKTYRVLIKKYWLPDKYSKFHTNGELDTYAFYKVLSCPKSARFEPNCNWKIKTSTNIFYLILVIHNHGYTTAFDQKFNFTDMSDVIIEKIELFNVDTNEYEEIDKNLVFNVMPLKNIGASYDIYDTVKNNAYNPDFITIAIRLKAKHEGINHVEFYFGEHKITHNVEISNPWQ